MQTIYVGKLPACGCVVAACLAPEDVAEMARNGYFIETVKRESVAVPGCKCSRPDKCLHCDPTFVPTGPDGWCDCKCHANDGVF